MGIIIVSHHSNSTLVGPLIMNIIWNRVGIVTIVRHCPFHYTASAVDMHHCTSAGHQLFSYGMTLQASAKHQNMGFMELLKKTRWVVLPWWKLCKAARFSESSNRCIFLWPPKPSRIPPPTGWGQQEVTTTCAFFKVMHKKAAKYQSKVASPVFQHSHQLNPLLSSR